MIILVLFGVGGTYLALNSKPKPQACTQDEKICPDGTSVGRNGPNCTFTPCFTKPTPTPDETVNWKTYKASFGSLKYPADWSIKEVDQVVFLAPPGADIFANTKQDTPGSGIKPEIIIAVISKSFSNSDSNNPDATNKKTMIIDGIQGVYYIIPGAPLSTINFDLSFNNGANILQFNLTSIGQENIDGFNKIYKTNVKDADEKTFSQILSTFKFLEASPTPTCRPRPACLDATPRCLIPETSDMCPKPVACTQEVKLCPDGKTYVGRQDPNCEFAPCPSN